MPRGKSGGMRHAVKVMRPADPQGEASQSESPTTLFNSLPCSIDTLTGRELERLQQMYATATSKVKFWGDPTKQVKATDWLIDEFGKRLNIVSINDPLRNQQGIVELICGEEVA